MTIEEIREKIINETYENADMILNNMGFTIRISELNNEPMVVTADFRMTRVNVGVVDNKIVKVFGFG